MLWRQKHKKQDTLLPRMQQNIYRNMLIHQMIIINFSKIAFNFYTYHIVLQQY